jgi:hypothetical protein
MRLLTMKHLADGFALVGCQGRVELLKVASD